LYYRQYKIVTQTTKIDNIKIQHANIAAKTRKSNTIVTLLKSTIDNGEQKPAPI